MSTISSPIDRPFKLGALKLPNRLVQAPMAGVSTRAFRLQARRFGVGLTWTEMVSSYGVHYRNQRTLRMLELVDGERPVAVQIFGSRPVIMAAAAAEAEEAGAGLVDINMGCPVRKVVKTGAGVALMEDEALAVGIVEAVVASVGIPVTAKIRSGPGRRVTARRFARALEEAGVSAVCIHPRLGIQGRKGEADHEVTARLVSELQIPVIASGDVDTAVGASALMERTGCAAVMVGRAALGNPWLFSDILEGRDRNRRTLPELLAEMERFYGELLEEMGEERAPRFMRKFFGWYLAPFRPGRELRHRLATAAGFEEAVSSIRESL